MINENIQLHDDHSIKVTNKLPYEPPSILVQEVMLDRGLMVASPLILRKIEGVIHDEFEEEFGFDGNLLVDI